MPAPQHDTSPVLYYNNGVAIYYTDSASKHNVPHEDIEYALFHPINKQRVDGRPRDVTFMFVGRPHELSRTFLEVGAAMRPDGRLEVFHAMELTDKWRWLLYAPGHTPWEE